MGYSLYYLKKKTEWLFFSIKLYNINLFCPTLLLKNYFCTKLYQRQKDQKNSVPLEQMTYDFILLRPFLILQMKKIAFDCFLLGLSQVAFQSCLVIINSSFFNPFISKISLFWILKNKNPFIACFFGFFFFLVNKQLVTSLFLLLTNCILFVYTKLVKFQQGSRDFKKTKNGSKDYTVNP